MRDAKLLSGELPTHLWSSISGLGWTLLPKIRSPSDEEQEQNSAMSLIKTAFNVIFTYFFSLVFRTVIFGFLGYLS
jgi:hypothetical protein